MGGDDLTLGENYVSTVQEGEESGSFQVLLAPSPVPLKCLSKIHPCYDPVSPAGPWLRGGCVWNLPSGTNRLLNGAPRACPQVKIQCRKGIPSALRARCWPLLCGAQVRQKNSPGMYQVRELARIPPIFFVDLVKKKKKESHVSCPEFLATWSPSLSACPSTGAGRSPRRPSVDGNHWQGPAPPVPSA